VVIEATLPQTVIGRLVAFAHPVLVCGLRDRSRPLLRAHSLFDFAVACVIAAVSGATQAGALVGGSCVPAALVMFACALGLTGYYAVVRPFAARLEVAVATAQAGTLAVLCGLTLGAVVTDGGAVSTSALSLAALAAEFVTFAAPVVLLIPVVREHLFRSAASPSTETPSAPPSADAVPAHEAPLLQLPQRPPPDQKESAEAPPPPPAADAPEGNTDCAQYDDRAPPRRNPLVQPA
jgi:hypothetical protein